MHDGRASLDAPHAEERNELRLPRISLDEPVVPVFFGFSHRPRESRARETLAAPELPRVPSLLEGPPLFGTRLRWTEADRRYAEPASRVPVAQQAPASDLESTFARAPISTPSFERAYPDAGYDAVPVEPSHPLPTLPQREDAPEDDALTERTGHMPGALWAYAFMATLLMATAGYTARA